MDGGSRERVITNKNDKEFYNVIGTALAMTMHYTVCCCMLFDGSRFVVFICLVLCTGLLSAQVFGLPSGRATIHRLLPIVCEEIPRATNFVSGEAAV